MEHLPLVALYTLRLHKMKIRSYFFTYAYQANGALLLQCHGCLVVSVFPAFCHRFAVSLKIEKSAAFHLFSQLHCPSAHETRIWESFMPDSRLYRYVKDWFQLACVSASFERIFTSESSVPKLDRLEVPPGRPHLLILIYLSSSQESHPDRNLSMTGTGRPS